MHRISTTRLCKIKRMSNSSPQNQVVIITGAGAGIGLALCKTFAQAGATVALNDLSPTLAEAQHSRSTMK